MNTGERYNTRSSIQLELLVFQAKQVLLEFQAKQLLLEFQAKII